MPNFRPSNSLFFGITFVLINLHLLRNLSVAFLLVLAIFYLFILLIYLNSKSSRKKNSLYKFCFVFLLFNVFLIFYSLTNTSILEVFVATQRVFFVMPLFFLSVHFIERDDILLNIIELYILIVVAGSISLVYQFFYGPISWFVDSSTRGDLARYGSLLGSLPTYGLAGSFAICLLPVTRFNYISKISIFYLLVIGLFLTLQKAGVINLILALIMLIYIIFCGAEKIVLGKVLIFLTTFVFFIFFIVNFFSEYLNVGLSFLGLNISYDNNIPYSGYGFIEDFNKRLFGTFLDNVSMLDIFFGMGFRGIGGAAGIEDGVMSHNGFLDLLLMGGVPYFIIFMLIIYKIFKLLLINEDINRDLKISIVFFYFLFLINFPMYTGILINPALCSIFWVFTGYLARSKRNSQ